MAKQKTEPATKLTTPLSEAENTKLSKLATKHGRSKNWVVRALIMNGDVALRDRKADQS